MNIKDWPLGLHIKGKSLKFVISYGAYMRTFLGSFGTKVIIIEEKFGNQNMHD